MVEPEHRHGPGRLVPVGLVDAAAGEIRLRCILAGFKELDPAEEKQFLPGTIGQRHLWGRNDVAIPISAVTGVDDGIRLNITKQHVQDLPPVDIDHPDGQTAIVREAHPAETGAGRSQCGHPAQVMPLTASAVSIE